MLSCTSLIAAAIGFLPIYLLLVLESLELTPVQRLLPIHKIVC